MGHMLLFTVAPSEHIHIRCGCAVKYGSSTDKSFTTAQALAGSIAAGNRAPVHRTNQFRNATSIVQLERPVELLYLFSSYLFSNFCPARVTQGFPKAASYRTQPYKVISEIRLIERYDISLYRPPITQQKAV